EIAAICLRSDVERKRPSPGGSPPQVCYSDAAVDDVYGRILRTAETLLADGYTVLVDATFLKQSHRQQFDNLANRLSIPALILSCEAPQPVLEERVQRRQSERRDPSDPTLEFLRSQLSTAEPLSDAARSNSLVGDTSKRAER